MTDDAQRAHELIASHSARAGSRASHRAGTGPLRALRALRVATRAVRHHGAAVARTHGVPITQQLLRLWRLRLHNDVSPEDFYRFRMYRLADDQALQFVPLRRNIAVRTAVYERLGLDPDALADKRRFGRAAAAAGIPVANTVADIADGRVHWWSREAFPEADLFVKEAAAMCGAGAAAWAHAGGRRWRNESTTLEESELLEHLAALSARAPLIVQERLRNHPDIADLAVAGLCTARIVTVHAPASDPRVLLAAFRMPTGDDVADNFARGGLACAVDVDTGTLGTAVRKQLSLAHLDVDRHPDTGAAISGRRLPDWSRAVDLAIAAHRVFDAFPSVGWDIAITPTGPVVVEANYNWDVVLAQQAGCRPLGCMGWPEHFSEWLRWTPATSTQHARPAEAA